MKYQKQEIVEVANACEAVQNQVKRSNIVFDARLMPTIGAYEADE
jgi:hypothetical protein